MIPRKHINELIIGRKIIAANGPDEYHTNVVIKKITNFFIHIEYSVGNSRYRHTMAVPRNEDFKYHWRYKDLVGFERIKNILP